MGKDPAFLFYPGDWLGGTMHMHRICRACYFDLLILQWSREAFTLEEAQTCLGSDFIHWDEIKDKFKQENSRYYNEKLRYEINRRKAYSESRKKGAYAKHMHVHMGNGNRNGNGIINLHSKDKESKSEEAWKTFKLAYPQNGSTTDPAAEKEFIKLVGSGIDPQQITKAAQEYAEYWQTLESNYPYGKYIAQAVNWLEKRQFAVDWVKKLEADKNQHSNKSTGRIINEYERSAAEKYKDL